MIELFAAICMLIPGVQVTIRHLVYAASMLGPVFQIMSHALGHLKYPCFSRYAAIAASQKYPSSHVFLGVCSHSPR
mgnify:FL=1